MHAPAPSPRTSNRPRPAPRPLLTRPAAPPPKASVERRPLETASSETRAAVRAVAVAAAKAPSSLAALRGYAKEDLFAIAELGYHYLMNGGTRLAVVLFEGLTAIAPDEPYFALAMGLAHDHDGDRAAAERWYARAGELDPTEPRADLNRAELRLVAGDRGAARRLLAEAGKKAKRRGQTEVARKAAAILAHLGHAEAR